MEYDCRIFLKYLVFRIRNFELLGFSHLEFEILGISKTIQILIMMLLLPIIML